MVRAVLNVIAPGPRTTFQDAGRPGHMALGVSPSGAADLASMQLANRLTGTDADAPALEIVAGGLAVRAVRSVRVALTGAIRSASVNGRAVAFHAPMTLDRDDLLALGVGGAGLYSYLAVDGGFLAERVLGSSATDTLGGIGPPAVRAGDLLCRDVRHVDSAAVDVAPVAARRDPIELDVRRGPRADWFAPDALARLCAAAYWVRAETDRVGTRLDGPSIARARHDELASEGLVRGVVQIPPDGRPLVFGPDHPVTGGYPVLAVVAPRSLAAIAQAEPGAQVRFRLLAEAREAQSSTR